MLPSLRRLLTQSCRRVAYRTFEFTTSQIAHGPISVGQPSILCISSVLQAKESSTMSSQEQTATQEVAAPASGDSNTSPTSNLYPPQEVLNFWFSGEYGNDEVMSSPEFEAKMLPMWFGAELTPEGPRPISPEMSAAIDKRCLKFVDTIRALGRNELVGEEWQTTDGLFAQIILGDQLARNCFRGSAEAYGFAHQTQAAARKIFDSGAYKQWRALPYFTFLSCVNLHSEDVADHVKNKVSCM